MSPRTRDGLRRALAGAAALVGLALAAPLAAGPARADGPADGSGDQASIAHVERTGSGFSVLLDVPAGTSVDLGGVRATVNGTDYDATAQRAGDETAVKRTAVIAIDTSDSMAGAKFSAAKQAASQFLGSAPANVAVGIVTFSSTVDDALAPTLDRTKAATVLSGLSLTRGTRLYDGVLGALDAVGTQGQRTVIVLSDGADTDSDASLDDVAGAVDASSGSESAVTVDVVALDRGGAGLDTLRRIAATGQVIPADDDAVAQAFTDEAATLQRQVAVSIAVPADVAAAQSSVEVSLPSTGAGTGAAATDVRATATLPAVGTDDPDEVTAPTADTGGFQVPGWTMYAGVGVFGVGLLVVLLMLAPARPVPLTAAQRVSSYTGQPYGSTPAPGREAPGDDALMQAKQAAAQVLSRSTSLDQRITARLDGAGSQLKSSEWLLVHVGVFLGVTVVGLLLGRGNLLLGLVFMLLGAVGPWVYLGVRRTRRRKAFNAVLPETLQLMSGSLSAGLSLAQSVDTIVREGAEPVASEFRRVLVETRLGVNLEDAFEGVAARFRSQDFAWVVMAIRIQRQVGGNLGELLDTVAATMREREYMRRQVAALAAEGKLSAYVLGGLPPIFLLYLLLTSRSYVLPLFTTGMGLVMLTGGGLLLGVGIFWMSKLVKVEV